MISTSKSGFRLYGLPPSDDVESALLWVGEVPIFWDSLPSFFSGSGFLKLDRNLKIIYLNKGQVLLGLGQQPPHLFLLLHE